MKMTDVFLSQLESEAARTRRALERVPSGRDDWKPHEKSMPLGRLAMLIARMPSWITLIVNKDELDLNPPGGGSKRPLATGGPGGRVRMPRVSLRSDPHAAVALALGIERRGAARGAPG